MARALDREESRGLKGLPSCSTLLALVQHLEDRLGFSEQQVVELVPRLVDSGRVVLTGNFAGHLSPFLT